MLNGCSLQSTLNLKPRLPFGLRSPSSVDSRDKLVGSASYHDRSRSDNEFMSWMLSSVLCFNCPKACVELHKYDKKKRGGTIMTPDNPRE